MHGVESLKAVGRFYFYCLFSTRKLYAAMLFQVLADTFNEQFVGVLLTNISAG